MEAGLRALGHRYFGGGGGGLGGFAAARATRLRRQRQRRMAAFCSREWQGIPPLPPSTSYRSGVSVYLTSLPTLANVSAVAVNGDGNGAAGGPVGSGVEVARARRMLHVVLVSPLIPGNTGSIARTCAASAVGLHLVGPLGYKVDDTKLKRAGLDYWPYVVVKIHDSWDHFCDYFMKQEGDKRLLAFTKRGTHIHSDFSYRPGDWLVFGSETKGLPQQALEDCCREGLGGGTLRIPMVETYVRCLNLSVSVGVALYEAARQLNYEQLQYQPDELPEEAQELFPAEDIYA
ncbi:AGAMOUS-like 26 [Zea mays]|nr:AGAMOUS-like 26 [Zea mays]